MRRQGGNFGFVILIVVLAVVLLLVARAWESVAPTAAQVAEPAAQVEEVQEQAQPATGEAVHRGNLPDLRRMKQSTDAHAGQVRDTLQETQ